MGRIARAFFEDKIKAMTDWYAAQQAQCSAVRVAPKKCSAELQRLCVPLRCVAAEKRLGDHAIFRESGSGA